jgi:hypothetical protein
MSSKRLEALILGLALLLAGLAGCTHRAVLRIDQRKVRDLTALGPNRKAIRALMILPPAGSERGAATPLADIEPFLLEARFEVISSGVTGRVVNDTGGNRVERAANLSDLERALVLAKASNVDVLFQISEIGWTTGYRSFIRTDDTFREVRPGISIISKSGVVRVRDAIFRIRGRIIDVESAEILASVNIAQNCSLVTPIGRELEVGRRTRTIGITADVPTRRRKAVEDVMQQFIERLQTLAPPSSADQNDRGGTSRSRSGAQRFRQVVVASAGAGATCVQHPPTG